ncbi:transcriptional regulator [Clostridium acetobutylicum]|nr:transcriptional regulator [Clostridium acetobutylicum]
MGISGIIRSYRKKENLTQEQVANYLNISTPAVNKWENGISYPDIALLAPLARILKTDVNTLLAFNAELTEKEVNKLGRSVGEIVEKEGYQKAFERGSDLIKQYSSCDELILRISSILRLFLVTAKVEKKDVYEDKIIAWAEIAAASRNAKTADMAKIFLSAVYRDKKEYKKAKEILDKVPDMELGSDKKIQQLLLLESSGEFDKAYGACEEVLLYNAQESLGAMVLIIRMLLKENKFSEAEEYTQRAKKLVEVFDLGEYSKYTLELSLIKEKRDKEKAVELIRNMIDNADSMNNFMRSKLYKHRKIEVTNSLDKDKYKKIVRMSIIKDKALDFVKDDPRVKSLLK